MLYWALVFLIVALVAAALGFGGVAGTASWIAQVLFVVFLVLFLAALLMRCRNLFLETWLTQSAGGCPPAD